MIFNSITPLSLNELQCLSASAKIETDTDEFLSWTANQNISFIEEKFNVLEKSIYRFQGFANQDSINFYSFGRSENRKMAAIKAYAEIIERLIFHEFTRKEGALNLEIKISDAKYEIQNSNVHTKIDKSFFNSNGWAVDFSAEKAIDRALREAIERHLLILTFAKFGWDGFCEVGQFQMDQFNFRSLVSKLSVAGFSSGMAICQSPSYAGISLGYLADETKKIMTSEKWEQAFYESYDLLRVKESNPGATIQNDLIGRDLDYYLNQPFNFNFSKELQNLSFSSELRSKLAVIDLKSALSLPFSFYAAVVHGGDLLPLYFKDSLSHNGKDQLRTLVSRLGISKLPERHPVL